MSSQNFADQYVLAVELAIEDSLQPVLEIPALERNGISGRLIAIHRSSMDISLDLLVPAYVFLYTA